jgi:IclR family transcriptional regulator, KDG regulon repressor
MPDDAAPRTEHVAAVLKVFSVVESLADQKSAGLADIAQRAMTSKSTTHRLLQTMIDLGYVEQDHESEKYRLTLKLFSLGARTLSGQADLLRIADRAMAKVSRRTGESINLGVMDDREQKVAYIHKFDSAFNLSMHSALGKRSPLHSTALGKALLAWRDAEEIRERVSLMPFEKLAPRTITDRATFVEQLGQIRAQGFAEEVEESEAGVRCLAAPVFDHIGAPVAAISIAFPLFRFAEERKRDYIGLLREAGAEVSGGLGFRG